MEKIGRPGGRNLISRFFKYLRNEEGETRKWYQKPVSKLILFCNNITAIDDDEK